MFYSPFLLYGQLIYRLLEKTLLWNFLKALSATALTTKGCLFLMDHLDFLKIVYHHICAQGHLYAHFTERQIKARRLSTHAQSESMAEEGFKPPGVHSAERPGRWEPIAGTIMTNRPTPTHSAAEFGCTLQFS